MTESNLSTREMRAGPTGLGLKVLIWGAIIAILALLAWGLFKQNETRPEIGEVAPGFSLRLFDGYYGEFKDGRVTLSNLKGRVVVINFWASWCIQCRVEAHELEETWQRYRDRGVVFVGVDFKDAEDKAIGYLQEFGITYPNGLDGRGHITDNSYHITGVPETFIVDTDGQIAYVKMGPFQPGELQKAIDKVLLTP